jgi:putative transposase
VSSVIRIAKSNKVLPRKPPNKAAKGVPMKDRQSLAYTKWECKYHIVIVPKYRIKILYEKVRKRVGQILRELCRYKGIEMIEGYAISDTQN